MPSAQSSESSAALVLHSARLVRIIRHNNHHIPAASVRTLSLIDQYGPATIKDLCAADQCSQPTMTGLVNGLVDRGWVQRDPNPDDARSSLTSLTPAGREELLRARGHNGSLIQERAAAAAISDADLALAASVLQRLTDPAVTAALQASADRDASGQSRE